MGLRLPEVEPLALIVPVRAIASSMVPRLRRVAPRVRRAPFRPRCELFERRKRQRSPRRRPSVRWMIPGEYAHC